MRNNTTCDIMTQTSCQNNNQENIIKTINKIIDDGIIDNIDMKEVVIEKLIKKICDIKELKMKNEKLLIENDALTKKLEECKK